MWPSILIAIYCVCLIGASLFGGWLPFLVRLTHTRMQLMMSFVGGFMLGVAILHLLPHAVVQTGSLDYAAWSCVLGLLTMFLTIRVFNVHQHGPVAEPDTAEEEHDHLHDHAHHDCRHPAQRPGGADHRFSWLGLFLGLAVHSLIDGVAVAASVVAAVDHGGTLGLLGVGTFLAVLFHKPLDSLSITSVMAVGDWSVRARHAANVAFSLICPAGALLFYFGTRELGTAQHIAVGCALGFAAGVFLCISLADILPEIQFHHHDRVKLTAALLVGVALSFAIGLFEPEHAHSHQAPSSAQHDHDHTHDH
ncbi:MAG: ZIP family metal transporter [Pirellulaceae bacterium]|jgi:zinc and cadmium transporter|nr:ZIP family metal transporter [Pirellulaceae bacterium]